MTLTEVAKAAGVSTAAVSKNNSIPRAINKDGSLYFDPNDKAVKNYIERSTPRRRAAQAERAAGIVRTKQPTTLKEQTKPNNPSPAPRTPQPKLNDIVDLDAEKLRQQIEKLRIENEESKNELVSRQAVAKFIGQLASVHSSILIPLGGRVGSLVASTLGVEDPAAILKVEELLQAECYRVIAMVKKKTHDFLDSIEAEGLDDAV